MVIPSVGKKVRTCKYYDGKNQMRYSTDLYQKEELVEIVEVSSKEVITSRNFRGDTSCPAQMEIMPHEDKKHGELHGSSSWSEIERWVASLLAK
jgi:hypothetical protein